MKERTRRPENRKQRIVSKTPLRISFVGGGTDIPWFYREHGGAVVSTAINKYVTVTVESGSNDRIYINEGGLRQYTGDPEAVENPYIREALRKAGVCSVSVTIQSDVGERGTGLGSSSALTVGLLNALYTLRDSKLQYKSCYLETLAQQACGIEIEVLGKPIGKQDQYAATYGGFRRYVFDQNGDVEVSECFPFKGQVDRLEARLLLFDTHIQRSADTVFGVAARAKRYCFASED